VKKKNLKAALHAAFISLLVCIPAVCLAVDGGKVSVFFPNAIDKLQPAAIKTIDSCYIILCCSLQRYSLPVMRMILVLTRRISHCQCAGPRLCAITCWLQVSARRRSLYLAGKETVSRPLKAGQTPQTAGQRSAGPHSGDIRQDLAETGCDRCCGPAPEPRKAVQGA